MDDLERVTFRFGGEIEVRYLARLPATGDLVAHGSALWAVVLVDVDALGTTVVCERLGDTDRHVGHVATTGMPT
jgi:hypothetical protein